MRLLVILVAVNISLLALAGILLRQHLKVQYVVAEYRMALHQCVRVTEKQDRYLRSYLKIEQKSACKADSTKLVSFSNERR